MSDSPLAVTTVPEYLQRMVSNEPAFKDMFGRLESADLGISFLKIVHNQSKEAYDNWDNNGAKKLEPGTMFLSRDHVIIPPGTPFFIVWRSVRYVKWEGKIGEGRIVGIANDPKDPQIVNEQGLTFGKDKNGNVTAPAWTQYTNFYVVTPLNLEEPALLSFYRTSTPIGRKVTQLLIRICKGGKLPLFAPLFRLDQPRLVVDGEMRWFQFNLTSAGFIKEKSLAAAIKLADMARFMDESARGSDYEKMEGSTSEESITPTLTEEEIFANMQAAKTSGNLAAETAKETTVEVIREPPTEKEQTNSNPSDIF